MNHRPKRQRNGVSFSDLSGLVTARQAKMRHRMMIGICVLAMTALPLELSAQKSADGAKAKAVARKGPSSVPKVNADAIFKKAFEAHVAGNQTEAIELFAFGLKREPGDANGWYFLGVSKLAANNLDGAIAAIGMGRGMGTAIQQARADQIYDELSELQRALPRYTMREGWNNLLAQALRLYQPPTVGKYRIVSDSQMYFLSRKFDRQKLLVNCGYSVPAGMGKATSVISSHENTVWPKLLHVGDGRPNSVHSTCWDGKKRDSASADDFISIGNAISLGTSSRDEFAMAGITGSMMVSGNPYVLKPENEWSYTSRSKLSVYTNTARSQLEGSALLGPLGAVQVYRMNVENSFVSETYSSSTTSKSERRETGVPFAAAYGIKRDQSNSSSSSDGSSSGSHDTRETLLRKVGNLDRPGEVLEFAHEIEDSDESGNASSRIITSTRVERLR